MVENKQFNSILDNIKVQKNKLEGNYKNILNKYKLTIKENKLICDQLKEKEYIVDELNSLLSVYKEGINNNLAKKINKNENIFSNNKNLENSSINNEINSQDKLFETIHDQEEIIKTKCNEINKLQKLADSNDN